MHGRAGRSALLVAAAAATAALATARASSEPVAGAPRTPPGADIAFSFGGRIHVMRADGSGRVRLTGGPAARQGDYSGGDSLPAWSPDGTTLAFVRIFESRSGDARSQIFLLDSAGGRPRPFTAPDPTAVSDPAWSPDGRRIAFVRWRRNEQGFDSEIVVAAVDGSGERVLQTEQAGENAVSFLREPAWAPDGAQLVYTRTVLDRRYDFRPSLYLMNADGGGARLLAADADTATWSPDGRQIAFSSTRDRNGKSCGSDECSFHGELYRMAADGADLVRLTRNRGDDRSPSWSPDGRRIAFASTRNYPQEFVNYEIYAIRPDGSCLTWRTNGVPNSLDPAWRQASTESRAPGRCGATRRRPIVDTDMRDLRRVDRDPVYWLGERYGNLLLGHAEQGRDGPALHHYFFAYDDCASFDPRDCPPDLQIQGASVCSRSGGSTLRTLDQPRYHHQVRVFAARGLLFVDIGQGDLSVITGRAHVRIFPGAGDRRVRRRLLSVARDLRPFGERARRLPAPALPRSLLRRLRRSERAYRRLGSLDAAAGALGITAQQLRRRLRLERVVRSLPRVRAITCPRR